jgi:catechol 2,3-dioxygenase-like lactoylglutathione lyase family enzyme
MQIIPNQLIPELSVSDYQTSLYFYTKVLGFSIVYKREEEGFAFLVLGNAHLMIDEIGKGRDWKTAELDHPLGRGVNFQIEVKSIDPVLEGLKRAGIKLFLETEEKWYRIEDKEAGNKQFLVQDPDGYLLRFSEDLGERSIMPR